MCKQGVCGSCLVSASYQHPVTAQKVTLAVNSCLVSVFSCQGWEITTVEGQGNRKIGYSNVQRRLSAMNGTQCGYCSPGMITNMHCLLKSTDKLTVEEIERSFGGQMCRCTGYRSILDSFKSLACDAPSELKQQCQDIEDLSQLTLCKQMTNIEQGYEVIEPNFPFRLQLAETQWIQVSSVADILSVFNSIGNTPYMLVAGNTAKGIYPEDFGGAYDVRVYIDVKDVQELRSTSVSTVVTVGGNVTITELLSLTQRLGSQNVVLKAVNKHLGLVAHPSVRNVGTIAGNLSIKHKHKEFQSDLFLLLECLGATLTIVNSSGQSSNVSPSAYLQLDMNKKIIKQVTIPILDSSFIFRSYKVMPRNQSALAIVNAAFLFKMNAQQPGLVVGKPTIVYGGINPNFVHAKNTENSLANKNLYAANILATALQTLDDEVTPDCHLPDASPAYRKGLTKSLLYKFVLSIDKSKVQPRMRSGGLELIRPLSSGKQTFETDQQVWPVNQPVPKLEALAQCSGEAKYIDDMPAVTGQCHAVLILSTVGPATVVSINSEAALKVKGVVGFFTAKDIPGKNSFTARRFGLPKDEEFLCSGKVLYCGQPLAILVAETLEIAKKAAKLVSVQYSDIQKPIVNFRDALQTETQSQSQSDISTSRVIKGSFDYGSQYHYTMETQCCIVEPCERDEINVYSSTQWIDIAQISISNALKIPENKINMQVRRLGGGFGGKLTRPAMVACACALAATKLNRPVRLILDFQTNLEAIGKRMDGGCDYEVGVDDGGKIQYLKAKTYESVGFNENDDCLEGYLFPQFPNCYAGSNWDISGKMVFTDVANNTYMRAPGSLEAIAYIETIMENIACECKVDPIQVRIKNMDPKDNTITNIINSFKVTSQYDDRKKAVENFNKDNRWKKRGISLVPMRWPFVYLGSYHALLSVYSEDGSVAVTHGGIEMGQGINTKVAQVVAYTLSIPLDLVTVKPTNNLTSPNDILTGSSMTSEACSYAAMQCCKELLERLAPVRETLDNPTWQQLISAADKKLIDLNTKYLFKETDIKVYNIYGVAIGEVEVDILTGEKQVLRVDIFEDCGRSLSPLVDIGQIEGSFVQGMGLWLTEHIVFDPDTGRLTTSTPTSYHVPGARDIPVDFRIQLRKSELSDTGVLSSKSTGEPAIGLSCVLLFAIRNALQSARKDAGDTKNWFQMNAPFTNEAIFLNSLTSHNQFVL